MSSNKRSPLPLKGREVSSVLAGLRYLQANERHLPSEIEALASDGGTLIPLTSAEIDELCEKVNCSD